MTEGKRARPLQRGGGERTGNRHGANNAGSDTAVDGTLTAAVRPSAGPAKGPVIKRPPGFAPRSAAVRVIGEVVHQRRALDEALERTFAAPMYAAMEPRDRAFARLMVVTVLRRYGELDRVVASFIDKPLPQNQGLVWPILLCATAQLLTLDTPPHAAISLAVEQARADGGARRFDKLVNAVLRRVCVDGAARLEALDDVVLNTPDWLLARWTATYGEAEARRIARANLREAALDIAVKADAAGWAERLGGIVLPTGAVRLRHRGRIDDLPGYDDGDWWVQDAAAGLPGRLLGAVDGMEIADLCAAPGGKTAELIAAGANVTAVDVSAARIARLSENLARLRLEAKLVTADVTTWQPGQLFEGVLLDAPCTATGTIRRHPDILRLKRITDIPQLAALQAKLLEAAGALVRPGGLLVYCSCSLEPEEGRDQIARFLSAHPTYSRVPVEPGEIGGLVEAISPEGDLRTLPIHLQLEEAELSGLDGFYAARLRRDA